MKRLVVFTGAGISQESGLQTFRDTDGLWEQYPIEEVATIEAWHKNPALVLEFYNKRRVAAMEAEPNAAHFELADLQKQFEVFIITQNIDTLHERAGSTNVIHLHGRIDTAKSSVTGEKIFVGKNNIEMGELCSQGHQIRPDIVWFGEDVPNMERAIDIASTADLFAVIGTSLKVYPAAGLIHYVPEKASKYLIDPNLEKVSNVKNLLVINEKATIGTPMMAKSLREKYG